MGAKLTALAFVSLIVGCAHPTAQQQTDAAQKVTCNGPEDCELKWARARSWISDNSQWKLRTITDNMLETFGGNDVNVAYEVQKFPLGKGAYEIQIKTHCVNMGLGCHPDETIAQASIKRYIMTGESTKF